MGGGEPEPFLSGESGTILGPRRIAVATVADALLDARRALRLEPWRLARAARRSPPRRRVLAAGVEREDRDGLLGAAVAELRRSRHEVEVRTGPAGERGKWENLDRLIGPGGLGDRDWLLAIDDDVALPRGFLDSFLFLAERFDLALAQPAHRRRSHAAWSVTRRQGSSVVRETGFVEIGPLTAFRADAARELLPFPPLRTGWGLDAVWAAVARERGWRVGVVDATPVGHALGKVAGGYDHAAAVAESRELLRAHPHVTPAEANRTLVAHRRW